MSNTNLEVINGSSLKIFLKYTSLNVISIFAMTSSGMVDAIFVGQYVGENALASVNIILPLFSILFGIGIMLSIGSAVRVGKLLGEGNKERACAIFTNSIVSIVALMLIITVPVFIFSEGVAKLLGSNDVLLKDSNLYLKTFIPFAIFPVIDYALSTYARVDNRPYLSTAMMVCAAMLNILLDYIFIAILGFGVQGAALATGLSAIPSTIVLTGYFLSSKSILSFTGRFGHFKDLFKSAYNGLSEFVSEGSLGFVSFIFNRLMMSFAGPAGVAAYTVVNYTNWACGMIAYAVGDALMPLISTNFGARRFDRVKSFTIMALIFTTTFGLIFFLLSTFFADRMVMVFLHDASHDARAISTEFLTFVKWSFLIVGFDIVMTAYFTGMHRPTESLIIAVARGAVLPIIMLLLLPIMFGEQGVYVALPVAHLLTVGLIIFLFLYNKKRGYLA